jgi:predicted flap endonuclease-1-like 5' DNA nuclease
MPADRPESESRNGPGPDSGPRQTLAMRLAERNRQRALRAERLARLRPAAAPEGFGEGAPVRPETIAEHIAGEAARDGTAPAPVAGPPAAEPAPGLPPTPVVMDGLDSAEALEEFLRALTAARAGAAPAATPAPPAPGALLQFQRPERLEPGDLDRLMGAGPGLIWALERAGLRRLADLAPLAPEDLVTRLGPIGRLVPAEAWLATAREATGA